MPKSEKEARHGGASTPPRGLQPMEEPMLEHRKTVRRKELQRETTVFLTAIHPCHPLPH